MNERNNVRLCIAYPNQSSFSETFIQAHINYLAPVCSLSDGYYPIRDKTGALVVNFPLTLLSLRGLLKRVLPQLFYQMYSKDIADYLKAQKVDVLLAEYGPTGVAMVDVCKRLDIPLIVHFHGFDAYHYKTIRDYRIRYNKMFTKAKAIIAVSQDMKKELIKLGADEEKVFINPYGVDVNKFSNASPENSSPLFIAVGRLTAKKSPMNTIKAFSIVLKECPDAQLIVVGDGEMRDECETLIKKLGISQNVQLQGAQSHDYIAKLLKNARAFVQHSMRSEDGDSEGMPNTILEASASGLPVISTYHAGIKEAVQHENTGYLVQEGDVNAMALYMIKLAKDPGLARKLGVEGKRYIHRNYRMEDSMKRLKHIIANSVS